MSGSPLEVVVIDDHHAWRQQLTAMVEKSGAWRVTGEAVNGVEGCALVASLRPDLILLDIELPTMSGIETAARILAADPSARILFLSGHSSWDVIEAALLTGARGYVLKNFAGTDLLPAMAAVAAGRRFLSAAIGGRPFNPDEDRHHPHLHDAGFYSTDAALIEEYEAFAAEGLLAGKIVVSLLGRERRQELFDRLTTRGIDVTRALAEERYIALDVDTLLTPLMIDGLPDESLFWNMVIALMMRAARASRTNAPAIAGFGDGAQTLWRNGMPAAAVLIEQMWNDVSKTLNVDVLCGYSLPSVDAEDQEMRELIGAAHSATRTR